MLIHMKGALVLSLVLTLFLLADYRNARPDTNQHNNRFLLADYRIAKPDTNQHNNRFLLADYRITKPDTNQHNRFLLADYRITKPDTNQHNRFLLADYRITKPDTNQHNRQCNSNNSPHTNRYFLRTTTNHLLAAYSTNNFTNCSVATRFNQFASGSVKGTISETGPLVPVTTAPTTPTVPMTPITSTSNNTWTIIGGSAAGVLVLALACFFCIRRHRKQQRKRRRLFASSDGLSSQTNIMESDGGNNEDGNDNDDDSDLDSEKAFFSMNPPVRVRSPQMTHPESHDLCIKTPLDQYEAQKYKWQDPIDVSNRHPQDHIRQQHLKRLHELQQEQLIKLNALVERYRVTYSRPQSPHSPVTTETRLSTRLSFFPDDDEDEAEEEELTNEEIQKLELKGDERLHHVPPVEDGPFRDQNEIEDEDVELQLLEVNHHYQGPFQDPEAYGSMNSMGIIFDEINLHEDPNAVEEADFEVASIITRSGSINLMSDSLEPPSEYLDKGKATARSIQDSDSCLGLPLSTRVSSDSLREAFGLRCSNSTLAASSTVGASYSGSIMGGSCGYSGGVGSSGDGGEGREFRLSGSGTEVVVNSVLVGLPKIQTGTGMDQLERQREREQGEILLKAIAQVKAQYADQYRQIHEELANLELDMEK
ncbi:hypothetical protein BGZ95_000294 [Linnemannia exigua]|uniref:Uncharacterized protein n=1 Tax=Linnemannia exigua TaxID=604196 RepID=A0AAD4HAE7_9FUNG|nr:hypothetical protein BGZ95_000294 [Linnemannia exigua]